jgi:hypothetical protein
MGVGVFTRGHYAPRRLPDCVEAKRKPVGGVLLEGVVVDPGVDDRLVIGPGWPLLWETMLPLGQRDLRHVQLGGSPLVAGHGGVGQGVPLAARVTCGGKAAGAAVADAAADDTKSAIISYHHILGISLWYHHILGISLWCYVTSYLWADIRKV